MSSTTKKTLEIGDFIRKMEKQERFSLTSSTVVRKIRTVSILVIIGMSILLYFMIIDHNPELVDVSILLISITSLWAIFFIGYKYLHTISIKGETLIIKSFASSPIVTSINSVKNAMSYNILGVQFTSLTYVLDGRLHKIFVIGSRIDSKISVARLIREAKSWSKKKKANHKPGSVLV